MIKSWSDIDRDFALSRELWVASFGRSLVVAPNGEGEILRSESDS
jgi:hypothetical protein